MRLYHFLPWLEAAGIDATVAPLFSDAYVEGLQRGQKQISEVRAAYQKRLCVLLNAKRFDLVWIEKEALPWMPFWLEHFLLPQSTPYVLDYDDAVFHYYDLHRNSFIRTLLAGKHPRLMRGAEMVIAGNSYLTDFARSAGAPRVVVFPTGIDLERYPAPSIKDASSDELPTVGWIGQRATASFLSPLAPVFRKLADEGRAQFSAIGIDAASLGLRMDSIPWTENSEAASISRFDIGIMPLVDGPFERGKCGYKLIQYMACGLPVVASPVGVNRQIVEHGVNGFLATTPEEWETAICTLLGDAELRRRMGQAGREKVEQEYCLQVMGPRLVELLEQGAASSCRKA